MDWDSLTEHEVEVEVEVVAAEEEEAEEEEVEGGDPQEQGTQTIGIMAQS